MHLQHQLLMENGFTTLTNVTFSIIQRGKTIILAFYKVVVTKRDPIISTWVMLNTWSFSFRMPKVYIYNWYVQPLATRYKRRYTFLTIYFIWHLSIRRKLIIVICNCERKGMLNIDNIWGQLECLLYIVCILLLLLWINLQTLIIINNNSWGNWRWVVN